MEIVLIVIIGGSILGEIVGRILRAQKLRKLDKDNIVHAQYEILEDLTPAEFGFLIDGRVGTNERIAEFIAMEQAGFVKFFKNANGGVAYERMSAANLKKLTDVQIQLVADAHHEAKNSESLSFTDNDSLVFAVTQSLTKKGWMTKPKRHRSVFSPFPDHWYKILAIEFVLLSFLFLVAAIEASTRNDISDTATYSLIKTILSVTFTLVFVWLFLLMFRRRFFGANSIGSYGTQKYKNDWDKLSGLALFMRVSGMDTMHPDYESLSFRDLDPLYPYAVAIGADRKVIKLLDS